MAPRRCKRQINTGALVSFRFPIALCDHCVCAFTFAFAFASTSLVVCPLNGKWLIPPRAPLRYALDDKFGVVLRESASFHSGFAGLRIGKPGLYLGQNIKCPCRTHSEVGQSSSVFLRLSFLFALTGLPLDSIRRHHLKDRLGSRL